MTDFMVLHLGCFVNNRKLHFVFIRWHIHLILLFCDNIMYLGITSVFSFHRIPMARAPPALADKKPA